MRICFHGTNEKNANKILVEGFQVGTYFAAHLQDALQFGGDHVFFVRFEEGKFSDYEPQDAWQFHIAERVPPEMIWKLIRYSPEQLLVNDEVRP